MLDKQRLNELNNFLINLENPDATMDIMVDRIDINALSIMHDYSKSISIVQDKTNIASSDVITCAMIIGYLLKGHIDRLDINKTLGDNNG